MFLSQQFQLRVLVTDMFAITQFKTTKRVLKIIPKLLSAKQIHRNHAILNEDPDEYLNVKIHSERLQFPYVWLRDNCQCEKCFHSSAKSRILDWSKLDPNIKPENVTLESEHLRVTWRDGHTSKFDYNWLKFRSFTSKNQESYNDTIYKPKKETWRGSDFEQICSKHDYNDILQSDEALHDWLQQLSIYGVTLIENAPHSENALDAVVAKIGFTKQTHYGVKFVIQSVPNTSNVAYLSSKLPMHTDLPYYEYCPGVNLLHCFVQTTGQGGENLLSDSHFVANYIKENHPQEYKLLTEVEVEWSDVGIEDGNEFFKLYRSPVIVLDKYGEITRTSFSIPQRGSQFPGPIDLVVPWYKAHGLFFELSHKFAAKFKSKAGNILVFDNIRLLHGRDQYEDNESNVRKLIGGYVDWDEIYSRLRCLKVKLNKIDY